MAKKKSLAELREAARKLQEEIKAAEETERQKRRSAAQKIIERAGILDMDADWLEAAVKRVTEDYKTTRASQEDGQNG